MFILKGMEEAVRNWMFVILVHLTTWRNGEPLEQWAVRTTGRRNSGMAPLERGETPWLVSFLNQSQSSRQCCAPDAATAPLQKRCFLIAEREENAD